MRTLLFTLLVTAWWLISPVLALEGDQPVIDPPHTSITFQVDHVLAPVAGRFDAFQGTMVFDPDNLEDSWIKLRIPVASIDTGVAQRDAHLRSPEFFSAGKHPDITFESLEIIQAGRGAYIANGLLTIKGVTRKVDVPFVYLGKVKNPNPKLACTEVQGIEAAFSLNRLVFNVGDGSWFEKGMLGDMVEVHLAMEILSEIPGCSEKPAQTKESP
jgi:polyisoprenoid-binding protein YceI